ncbi:MAG TPA: hypothetical protein PLH46_02955 [Caldisericia bacterium]|nr:hypothetical protein [Caldisericia bacterium]
MRNPDQFFHIIQSSDKFTFYYDNEYTNKVLNRYQKFIYTDVQNYIMNNTTTRKHESIIEKKFNSDLQHLFLKRLILPQDLKGYL